MSRVVTGARPRFAVFRTLASTVADTFRAIYKHKLGKLAPLVVLLLIMAAVIGVITLVPAISPFVYPLF